MLIRTLEANVSEILSEIYTFSINACENVVWEMAAIMSRPLYVLNSN